MSSASTRPSASIERHVLARRRRPRSARRSAPSPRRRTSARRRRRSNHSRVGPWPRLLAGDVRCEAVKPAPRTCSAGANRAGSARPEPVCERAAVTMPASGSCKTPASAIGERRRRSRGHDRNGGDRRKTADDPSRDGARCCGSLGPEQERLAVRGAVDLDLRMGGGLEALDDDEVDGGEAREELGEAGLRLGPQLMHQGPAPLGGDQHLRAPAARCSNESLPGSSISKA